MANNSDAILHYDFKAPRFTGEEGGIDVYTLLSTVDDIIKMRRLTIDEDKIIVLVIW